MTVKELIEKLKELDQTADVVFDEGGAFFDVSYVYIIQSELQTVELLEGSVVSTIVLAGDKC